MVRVRLLGGLSLELEGEPLPPPERRASRSLLAWLVLHPRMHSRAALAARFWPDVLDSSARSSLRTALTDVRRALGPSCRGLLTSTREQLGVVPGPGSWADVWEFERLVRAGRLAAAVELCRGDLLAGLDDDWVLDAREAHREELGGVLERLAENEEARGRLDEALRWTRRRVALDPLREDAQRALLRRLASADRSAALAAYERLRERLRSELGVAPSRETRELVERLRRGAPDPTDGADGQAAQRPGRVGSAGVGAADRIVFLFAMLAEPLGASQRFGHDQAELLRAAHLRLLGDVVAAAGASDVSEAGDGVAATFDDAAEAVAAAVQLQQESDRHARALGADRPRPRIGLHGAPSRSRQQDERNARDAARRLAERAPAGAILASQPVAVPAGGGPTPGARAIPVPAAGAEAAPAVEIEWEPLAALRLPLPLALAAPDGSLFVGRATDFENLRTALEQAHRTGRRRLVMVDGDAGIGKTTLARELALRAEGMDATVLYGRCDEEMVRPYQPFVEALAHYVRACPARSLRLQLGGLGGELTRLVPELAERLPDVRRPLGGDPEGARYRLFEAAGTLLTNAARLAPTLLVLDDLHWADGATLALLKHVMRSPAPAALLVLGTYRSIEVGPEHPLAQVLADLGRERPVDRLALTGLGERETAELATAGAGRPLPSSVTRGIWEDTEGNPFFVGEMVRNLAEALAAPDHELGAEIELRRVTIPEGVKEVIARRLAKLDERLRAVLTIAAAIGREFDFDVLERLASLRADELAELLEQAVAAHVLEEDAGRFGRFRFVHALIRETLHERLTAVRRTRLHLRVAQILEQLRSQAREEHTAEIAYHLFAALPLADVAEAVRFATKAAEQATAQLAYEEAVAHYENALRALDSARAADGGQRCELLLALGEALWGAGEFERCTSAFRRAAELAEAIGAPQQLARAALGFGGQYVAFQAGAVDEALVELLEKALRRLDEADSPLRARVLARLAEALTFSPQRERKEQLAREAVEMARRVGEPTTLGDVLLRAHWARWSPDSWVEDLPVGREIVELGRRIGDKRLVVQGRDQCIEALVEAGDLEAVRLEVAAYTRAAEELRQPYPRWEAAVLQAMLALIDGRLGEAEELAESGLVLGVQVQNTNAVQLYAAQLMFLRREQARLDELVDALEGYAGEFPDVAAWSCALAWVYAEIGRESEARRRLDALAALDFADLPRDMFWITCLWFLAESVAVLDDHPRAETLLRLLRPYADRWALLAPSALSGGSLARSSGLLATTLRRYDEAEKHFETALDAHARAQAWLWLAHTRHEFGRMLLARGRPGDRERAMTLLLQAQEAAADLELTALARRAAAVTQARSSGGGSPPARAVRPAPAPPERQAF